MKFLLTSSIVAAMIALLPRCHHEAPPPTKPSNVPTNRERLSAIQHEVALLREKVEQNEAAALESRERGAAGRAAIMETLVRVGVEAQKTNNNVEKADADIQKTHADVEKLLRRHSTPCRTPAPTPTPKPRCGFCWP